MIHVRIFKDYPNHMPPMTSNNGGHLPTWEEATVYNNGFQMPQLLYSYCIEAIYMIHLKMI